MRFYYNDGQYWTRPAAGGSGLLRHEPVRKREDPMMQLIARINSPVAAAVLLLFAAACSGEQGIDAEGSEAGEARLGLVSVGYQHDWMESQDTALLTATAQFVRYSAGDHDQVARLLALPLDPRTDLPQRDRCQLYDLSIQLGAESQETEEPGYIELLEAGDLKVETEGSSVTLYPSHFPGLLPFISGVTYGEARAAQVGRAHQVRASSGGGESVGPFSAQLPSPALPRLISIAGNLPGTSLTVEKTRGVEVQWEASASSPDAVTYIAIRHTRGKRDLALRCRVQDDGTFTLPAAMIADISGRVEIEMARLRQTPFSALGLERGELRVTVRDTATIALP